MDFFFEGCDVGQNLWRISHLGRSPGNVKSNPNEEKTAYGNSFAIFALAAYHHATGDTSASEARAEWIHVA